MLEARVIKISNIEKYKNGYFYSLVYNCYGEIKEVERFYEYDTLRKGDIIYV